MSPLVKFSRFLMACARRPFLLVAAGSLFASALAQIIIIPGGGGGGGQVTYTTTNVIHFASTNYVVSEDSILALITVVREGVLTNDDIISIDYTMIDGTALSGIHYFKSSGTVRFLPGEDRTVFSVQLIDNFAAGGDVSLTLILRNPTPGDTATWAVLGEPSVATLTIRDDETVPASSSAGFIEIAPGNSGSPWKEFFEQGSYIGTKEEWNVDLAPSEANFLPYGPQGIQVTIVRKGGSRGKILVDWQTTTNTAAAFSDQGFFDFFFGFLDFGGGLAAPFDDFIPTNGTVALNDFQMSTNVLIRLPATLNPEHWRSGFGVNDINPFIFPKTFAVELTGTRAAPEEVGLGVNPVLGEAIKRNVLIADAERGFAFTRLHYEVREGQASTVRNGRQYVRVRVRRSMVYPEMPPGPTLDGVHVHYTVNPRRIVVDARGGDSEGNVFGLEPGSDYTTPYVDYEPPGDPIWSQTVRDENLGMEPDDTGWVQNAEEATLTWGTGEVTDRFILIPIADDAEDEFNEDIEVVLWKHGDETDGIPNPWASVATIKILDNDQPAGASEVDFNPDNVASTVPPYMTTPGANNTVQAVLAQPDGKVLLGGDFTSVNTADRLGIARLNFDGSTDFSFNPGTGVSGFVQALAQQPDGKILVGGQFDSVNGITRFGIARLQTNGTVDTSFNPGLGTESGAVRTIAVQADGKVLIGGDFLSVDGTNQAYVARLHSNGKLDTTFNTGTGPNGPVNSIATSGGSLDIDRSASGGPAEDRFVVETGATQGSITINYDFLSVPDTLRVYYDGQRIFDTGLISSNGTLTVNYGPGNASLIEVVMNEGSGLVGTIWFYDMQINPLIDQRPILGGEFTEFNGTPMNFVARLTVDGGLDPAFDPGIGADDTVYSVAKLGNKIVMAGDFKTVNLLPRRGIARLNESGLVDPDFDPGTGFDNTVYTVGIQSNGKAVLGGSFFSFNATRRIGLARLNLDGSLDTTFMDTAKNQYAGIPNPLSPENIQSPENFIRSLSPYRLTNITVGTNIVIDTDGTTNEILFTNVALADHLFVGGRFSRFGGGFARDDYRSRLNVARLKGHATPGPGNISFAQRTYTVDENAGRTFITLVRTNGSLAPISARFDAQEAAVGGPGVASGGSDFVITNYFPLWVRSHDRDRQYSDAYMGPNNAAFSTNRQRTDFNIYAPFARPPFHYRNFESDEDNVFITIPDDNSIEGNEVISLSLTSPDQGRLLLGGEPIPVGTALGITRAELIISDNDFSFGTLGFSAPEYFVNEDGLDAVITVTRLGGSTGTVFIDVSTQNGTAGTGDYSFAPRRLTFGNGITTNRFSIRINNDVAAELEETILILLTNASGFPTDVAPNLRLDPARSTAVLTIIDNDFAPGRVSFTAATNSIPENETEVTVSVRRTGGNLGEVFVNYATVDGTARAGRDYVATNGVLHWVSGDSETKTFKVKLIDNLIVESDKLFTVALSNPTIVGAIGAQPTTVVRIQNDDAYGQLSFSQASYHVDENGPYADITVLRQNGLAGAVEVSFAATNSTAIGSVELVPASAGGVPDYVLTNGVLRFAPGETSQSFRVRLIDDNIVEGDKQISLLLSNPRFATIGLGVSTLTIVDNELVRTLAGSIDTEFLASGANDYVYTLALQEDGKILLGGDFGFVNGILRNRLARLFNNGGIDHSYDPGAGPNASVRTIALQPDVRSFVGGLFTSLGATNRNYVTRLNIDSKVDPTYNPGAGTDNPINVAVLQPDGNVLIGGEFSTYRGIARSRIARTTTNGTLDTLFDPGTAANATVYAIAVQPDGKILVGGNFTLFADQPRNRLVRLLKDGSLDTQFAVANGGSLAGANDVIRTIVLQSDGKILIGGSFTTIHGQSANRLARLNVDGTIDASFTPGSGANGAVNIIALQIDGKILAGGDFTTFDGRTRGRVTRLNSDGTLDPTINFGAGANASVSAIIVQPDRRILLAGGFTDYDGTPADHLVRIHGGSIAGSGRIEFTRPFFRSSENATNSAVTIRRTGGTTGSIAVNLRTVQASATAGLDFVNITTNLVFPEAETFRTVLVPLLDDTEVEPDEIVNIELSNPPGTDVLGGQPNATLTLESDDSILEFSSAAYSVSENFVTGSASVTVRRVGSTVGQTLVTFLTRDGTAVAPVDYLSVSSVLTFNPGEASRTFSIPILDDSVVEGNETVQLILTNVVGRGIIGLGHSTLTINDNDFAPGDISFTSDKFTGSEGSGRIMVTVRRAGGTTGIVSADYRTRARGGTGSATPQADYEEQFNGIVSFAEGETLKSFLIPVFDDDLVEGNEDFIVSLSNPKGGARVVGSPDAIATIVDDDLGPGSLDEGFSAGTDGAVRVIKVDNAGNIYLGGAFTVVNDANRPRVARLISDGSVDPAFDPGAGPDGVVADLDLGDPAKVLISGGFNTVGGIFHNRVARLDRAGNLDPTFNLPLGLNAEVSDLSRLDDGRIVISGLFNVASAASLRRIARLGENGTLDLSFNPGFGADEAVHRTLVQPDGKVVVVGAFSSINGISRRGIARLNTDGSVDSSFALGLGASGPVRDVLLLDGGKMLIAGDFTAVHNSTRLRVARLNADGSVDATFNPGAGVNGPVYSLARQPDGKVFIAGDFTAVGSVERARVARLLEDGGLDVQFSPGDGPNAVVYSVVVQPADGKVLIGGAFTTVDRAPHAYIARFNNDKDLLPTFEPIVISQVLSSPAGRLSMRVATQAGFAYALEASKDLVSWNTVKDFTATATTTELEEEFSNSHRFFRVRRVAPQ